MRVLIIEKLQSAIDRGVMTYEYALDIISQAKKMGVVVNGEVRDKGSQTIPASQPTGMSQPFTAETYIKTTQDMVDGFSGPLVDSTAKARRESIRTFHKRGYSTTAILSLLPQCTPKEIAEAIEPSPPYKMPLPGSVVFSNAATTYERVTKATEKATQATDGFTKAIRKLTAKPKTMFETGNKTRRIRLDDD